MKVERNKKKKTMRSKALIKGGGPIGMLAAYALKENMFEVWISEDNRFRKNTIKRRFKDKVRFFDEFTEPHKDMKFELVLMATSNPEAYKDVFDLVTNWGTLYLFSGIDDAHRNIVLDPLGIHDLEKLHRLGTYCVTPLNDGRIVIIGGHSGYDRRSWNETIRDYPQWAPHVDKIITGVINGFDSKMVQTLPKELRDLIPYWRVTDERKPVVEDVLSFEQEWPLRYKHLRLSILSEKGYPFFDRYLKKKINKKDFRYLKSNWYTLITSHLGIRLSVVYEEPYKLDKGWVLLKIIAVNLCTADLRANRGSKFGREDYIQAFHNGLGIVIRTNLEEGDESIKIGDLVVPMPHWYTEEQKQLPEYISGDLFAIQDDWHMGFQCMGCGGEYCKVPAKYIQVIPYDTVKAVVDILGGEKNEEAKLRTCYALAECEHVACIITMIHLLKKWNEEVGGCLNKHFDDKNTLEVGE